MLSSQRKYDPLNARMNYMNRGDHLMKVSLRMRRVANHTIIMVLLLILHYGIMMA